MQRTFFLPTTLASVALAVSLTACGDEVTDPAALLESAEAEAVMRSAAALPSLSGLIDGAAPSEEADRLALVRARELWVDGLTGDPARGRARRRVAARRAAPILVRTATPEEWAGVRVRVDAWIQTADAMLQHLQLPEVTARVAAARRDLRLADDATTPGLRVQHLLLATAELVETTPRFVARTLSDQAERAVATALLASSSPDAPFDGEALERAERLKDWAGQAVAEEDYLLAIQRAYYALQLVEGRGTR